MLVSTFQTLTQVEYMPSDASYFYNGPYRGVNVGNEVEPQFRGAPLNSKFMVTKGLLNVNNEQ